MVIEMRKQDAAQAAAMVQQTGSAYVSALAALADAVRDPKAAHGTEVASAREVATNSLHAAASELVRLAPEEPLAAQILRGLDQAARGDSVAGRGATEQRKVAWY
jgi:major membrane immunogen (membrane-anchored lipoprotein)